MAITMEREDVIEQTGMTKRKTKSNKREIKTRFIEKKEIPRRQKDDSGA